jgi:Glycosyltransferase family 9 (heptosyltransferase)
MIVTNKDPQNIRALVANAPILAEYVGGLGDCVLRMYQSGEQWYGAMERLSGRNYAVVVLMCHNPYLAEVWHWHPKAERIHVIDFGFNQSFHPWENPAWRFEHGLQREAPCPPSCLSETLRFYPSPEDEPVLSEIKKKPYIIMAATAGDPAKTIPLDLRETLAAGALTAGFNVVVVGRSRYFRGERTQDVTSAGGIINAVDRLSVPGVAEAVKGAAGVISADSAVLHMAWHEHRPVFLLYNHATVEKLIPLGPVGYMQGIDRADTDHMEFANFDQSRLIRWLMARQTK